MSRVNWEVVFDLHSPPVGSYEDQVNVIPQILSGAQKGVVSLGFPELINRFWQEYGVEDKIIIVRKDGSYYQLPHHNENITHKDGTIGKCLRKEHNIHRLWMAARFEEYC